MSDYVRIFDTTLRDGEQAPGFSMGSDAKLRMARALARLKVDIIEAGFAAASPGDSQSITDIAHEIDGPIICSLARTARGDIDAAAAALQPARRKRIHVFIGTSPTHREFKLHKSRDEVLEAIRTWVTHARSLVDDVEFSAEDAIRTERDFLAECLSTAAMNGASTLNVPDTVGYTTPEEIFDLFSFLGQSVDRPDGTIFSAHCHDDLGMAVANSLAAVRAGARQVECAVNGIGERAGNCALEEVVMALRTRADAFDVQSRVDTTQIMAASRTLAQATNSPAPRNKSIVGANAFAHESGIHQHGVLQNRETYEIMKPEDVGLSIDNIVLGKHSGRHALAARAKSLGYVLDSDQLDRAFTNFKAVADEVGIVNSARLLAILGGLDQASSQPIWKLSKVDILSAAVPGQWPAARIVLEHGADGTVSEMASAPGALDAAFSAVSKALGVVGRVDAVDMQYIAAETDAAPDEQGASVLVEMSVEVDGQMYAGRARARDILPCCVAAYLDAITNAQAVIALGAAGVAQSKAA